MSLAPQGSPTILQQGNQGTRQTAQEMGGQHQRLDWSELRNHPTGSRRPHYLETSDSDSISGAPIYDLLFYHFRHFEACCPMFQREFLGLSLFVEQTFSVLPLAMVNW